MKNATLLAQELLTQSTHGAANKDTVDQWVEGVQSSREWAEKLLTEDSEGNTSLALFLLEDATIEARDIDALAMVIRVILRNGGEAADVRGAIDLLEKFYGGMNETAWPTGRIMHNMPMLLGNEKHVRTVTILFEEMLKAPKFYENTSRRYQLFIVILMCYVGHRAHDDANFDISALPSV